MHFITGETIQLCCDHFVGTLDDFNYNPKMSPLKERFIYLGNREPIDNLNNIFGYTHALESTQELINTLKTLQNPFKLIFHNSDHNFENQHLILFDELPLLKCIYTQNMNVIHPRLHPLPIGLANSMWPHGNPLIHKTVFEMNIVKDKEIYFNFNINTNPSKRRQCLDAVTSLGVPWSDSLPYLEYMKELKRHKFAICPEGNGIDTHRFYECLYMNVVPICKRNILTEYYSKIFPVILLNEWQDLNINNLTYSNINVDMLDINIQILYKIQTYTMTTGLFDIVIPLGPDDKFIIKNQIEYTKKNVVGYRNIYLISYDPSIVIDGCITICEDIFPFSMKTVSNIHGELSRNGWYLQQLLKLYALLVIPDILDRCLILDSDTFFLKPTRFIDDENQCLYASGCEYHTQYFDHMSQLNIGLSKVYENRSGICHHMMFEKVYITEIINKIEQTHNDTFYNVFLKLVTDTSGAGASEYEIYFNYMFKNYSDKVKLRYLKWVNSRSLPELNSEYDYISYHWHMR